MDVLKLELHERDPRQRRGEGLAHGLILLNRSPSWTNRPVGCRLLIVNEHRALAANGNGRGSDSEQNREKNGFHGGQGARGVENRTKRGERTGAKQSPPI